MEVHLQRHHGIRKSSIPIMRAPPFVDRHLEAVGINSVSSGLGSRVRLDDGAKRQRDAIEESDDERHCGDEPI